MKTLTELQNTEAMRMIFRATKTAGKATKAASKPKTGRKAGKLAGGAVAKAGRGAGKAALKAGKGQARLTGRALSTKEPGNIRFLKYGFFALAGFMVGALLARMREKEISSPASTGETWGTETPLGTADGPGTTAPAGVPPGMVSDPARPEQPQRPEDPNRTGYEREYSDPSAGPLIGRRHHPERVDIPVQQQEVENRIRTKVGEDPRTLHLPRLNVEVNEDVAEIYGEVPSEEDKQAVEEIAANTDGVNEVRNHLTVNPQSPTRENKAAGGEPDRP
jgi:hypothetical protein